MNENVFKLDEDRNVYCLRKNLVSFAGAPSEVVGIFCCHSNNLTSLEGGPSVVGGDYCCFNNQLTSLKGFPSEVGGFQILMMRGIY